MPVHCRRLLPPKHLRMRYFILALVFVATVASREVFVEEDAEKLKAIDKECKEISQVDHKKVQQVRNKHFTEDEKLKEFLFCYYKKLGWMDSQGHLDKIELMAQLGKNAATKEAMEKCMDKYGDHGPETAYSNFKCYVEHLPTTFKATINP